LPFIIVSVPAVACALAVLCTTSEPPRGMCEDSLKGKRSPYEGRITLLKITRVFYKRCNLLVFAQGFPGCIPWGVMNAFFTDYLSQQKGLEVEQATGIVLVFGIGAAVGNIVGGMWGQKLYNKRKESLPLLMGVTTFLGALPILALTDWEVSGSMYAFSVFLAFLGGALSCVTGANVRAVLINVNTPETRGTTFAMLNLMDDLGKGAGPAAVAGLITRMGSRRAAFNLSISFWFPCAICLGLIAKYITKEEAETEKEIELNSGQRVDQSGFETTNSNSSEIEMAMESTTEDGI
jgi:predicted MFS family arabinose efflux permease